MTTKKLHYSLLFFSLVTSGFIYLDTYLIPTKQTKEIVTNILRQIPSSHRGSKTYLLNTNADEYIINESIYTSVNIGDTIGIQSSVISGSVQKIAISKDDGIYNYFTGYARVGIGILYVPIVLVCNILLLIFYRIIRNPNGEANLTYAVFIASMILLFFHISY